MTTTVGLPHPAYPYLNSVGEEAVFNTKLEADPREQNTLSDCLNLAITYSKHVADYTESAFLTYLAKAEELRDTKSCVHEVNTLIKSLSKDKTTVVLSQAVVDYIEQRHLFISGIYEEGPDGTGEWKVANKAVGQEDLEKISSELSNTSSRLTDMAGPELLHQQKLMQALSLIYLTLNQIQVMANDLMKSITQGIR